MKSGMAAAVRRNRWAISFADLSLLLLGFFVLLQSSGGKKQDVIAGVAQQFGAPVRTGEQFAASALFQPGEAMLTDAGKVQVAKIAAHYAKQLGMVEIRSIGVDAGAGDAGGGNAGNNRFDGWDLAAARLGAVARALVQAGVARENIIVRGLDDAERSKNSAGQQIIFTQKPKPSPAS